MVESIAGARCALHPDQLATATCKRCGNFACEACHNRGADGAAMCVQCAQTVVRSRYHVVPVWRFVVLSLASWGLYELYWFWKNWSRVKAADGSDIWPMPRAAFAGVTYFSLISDINTQLAIHGGGQKLSPWLGLGFLTFSGLQRLPDPYWMISLFGVLFLLPTVRAIHQLATPAARAQNAPWRLRHTVAAIICLPLSLLVLVGTLMPDEGFE